MSDTEIIAEARRLIQTEYDNLVEDWGHDGSTLDPDFDYHPQLNQLRDMYHWLARVGRDVATGGE